METLERSQEEKPADAENPSSVGAALGLLMSRYARERLLLVSGLVGIGLGLAGLLTKLVHGPIIEPEGVLQKAISFDLALGVYVLTVLLFLPLAKFSERGLSRWRGWHVSLTYITYSIENIQIGRGLDPRFSRVGSPVDSMLGGFFFLVAVGLLVLFLIMNLRIFRKQRGHENALLLLAARYAFAATILAFGGGFWMSFIGGPITGTANILPLHAIGFHGLQTVPVLALFLGWSEVAPDKARRWIHIAGLTWLSACVTIAWQTGLGRSLTEFLLLPGLTVVLLVRWGVVAVRVTALWLKTET